jgi:hypothetical protein
MELSHFYFQHFDLFEVAALESFELFPEFLIDLSQILSLFAVGISQALKLIEKSFDLICFTLTQFVKLLNFRF